MENNQWLDLLFQILEVCIIPLLGVLTAFLVKFIKAKSNEITTKVDNDIADKYISMLADTISACVIATNQTYVEALKKDNAFTKEAQEEAFKMTYEAIMLILTEDAVTYLTNIYGDLSAYITAQIEAEVNKSK
jgi:hypothetical protein